MHPLRRALVLGLLVGTAACGPVRFKANLPAMPTDVPMQDFAVLTPTDSRGTFVEARVTDATTVTAPSVATTSSTTFGSSTVITGGSSQQLVNEMSLGTAFMDTMRNRMAEDWRSGAFKDVPFVDAATLPQGIRSVCAELGVKRVGTIHVTHASVWSDVSRDAIVWTVSATWFVVPWVFAPLNPWRAKAEVRGEVTWFDCRTRKTISRTPVNKVYKFKGRGLPGFPRLLASIEPRVADAYAADAMRELLALGTSERRVRVLNAP